MALGWGRKTTTSETHEDEEMSMDEILASIRRYVSDDSAGEENRPGSTAATPTLSREKEKQEKDFSTSGTLTTAGEEEILELRKVSESQPSKSPHTTDSRNTPGAQVRSPAPSDLAETLSQESQDASVAALSQLMTAFPAEKEEPARAEPHSTESMTLDRLLRELARPIIYQWLDQHLPKIVERLVAQELEKLTQHVRR